MAKAKRKTVRTQSARSPIPNWALKGWTEFRKGLGAQPFSLGEVSAFLFAIAPASWKRSTRSLAFRLLSWARAQGEIVPCDDLNWLLRKHARRLTSGRFVPEHADILRLQVRTRCPEKYVLVDLERGDVWQGSEKSWKAANDGAKREVSEILKRPKGRAV